MRYHHFAQTMFILALLSSCTVLALLPGQIVKAKKSTQFLIFQEQKSAAEFTFRPLIGRGSVTLGADEFVASPFAEGVSMFLVTQYALDYFFRQDLTKGNTYLELASALGDSARVRYLRDFTTAAGELRRALQSNRKDQDLCGEILHNFSGLALVEDAMNDRDFFAAIALLEQSRNIITTYGKEYKLERAVRMELDNNLQACTAEMLKRLLTLRQNSNPREAAFQELFPQTRGALWGEGTPSNYNQLIRGFQNSFAACQRLDKLSRSANFAAWASDVLSVLYLLPGNPECAFLEEEFDDALLKYKKLMGL